MVSTRVQKHKAFKADVLKGRDPVKSEGGAKLTKRETEKALRNFAPDLRRDQMDAAELSSAQWELGSAPMTRGAKKVKAEVVDAKLPLKTEK